jgi:hypothetical protein
MKKLYFTVALVLMVAYIAFMTYTKEGLVTAKAKCVGGKCSCPSGYAYDIVSKDCKQSSTVQDPISPNPLR